MKKCFHFEVLESLELIGAMSAAELALHHGRPHLSINSAIGRLRKIGGLVHIAKYERQPDGQRGRCIPMYEAGPGEDAEPLKRIPHKIVSRKSEARHRGSRRARHYPGMNASLGIWKGLV